MTQISRVRGARSRQTRGEYTQEESTPGVPDFLLTAALGCGVPIQFATKDAVPGPLVVPAEHRVSSVSLRRTSDPGPPVSLKRGCAQRTRGLVLTAVSVRKAAQRIQLTASRSIFGVTHQHRPLPPGCTRFYSGLPSHFLWRIRREGASGVGSSNLEWQVLRP